MESKTLLLLCLVFLATYCKKDETATLGKSPTILTQLVTNISATGVSLIGTVNPNYLSTTVTFEYGTTKSYGSTVTASESPLTGNTIKKVSASISALTAGTTYHFRIKGDNSMGVVYGSDMEFIPMQAPKVTTLAAKGMTLNGAVNANGSTTSVSFLYQFPKSEGWRAANAVPSTVTGDSITYVSANINHSGPWPGCYKVKAENSCGVVYGNVMSISKP